LSHPHICSLFDIGQQDEVSYLVIEYLEGETLAARLEKGRLKLDQARRSPFRSLAHSTRRIVPASCTVTGRAT
jgi:serine/threonine protein kinase